MTHSPQENTSKDMTMSELDKELAREIENEIRTTLSMNSYIAPSEGIKLCKHLAEWHTSHLQSAINEAKVEGAKNYNRILTNEMRKTEYVDMGTGKMVGVYRQSDIGSAIRKANNILITTNKGKE